MQGEEYLSNPVLHVHSARMRDPVRRKSARTRAASPAVTDHYTQGFSIQDVMPMFADVTYIYGFETL